MIANEKMLNAKLVNRLWKEDYCKIMKKMNALKALFPVKFVRKKLNNQRV